jgi:hypothetical protein
MKLGRLASFGWLVPGLLLGQAPAMAVPGWAQLSRPFSTPPQYCVDNVGKAITEVTGSGGTFDKISDTTYLMTTYPQGTTGVFIYCVSNPKLACSSVSSTVLIVAFSDNGSQEAAYWIDRLNTAISDVFFIDCGSNNHEVQ